MINAKALWTDVQDNQRKLRGCSRHRFTDETVIIGARITCEVCGGSLRLTDIGQYIAGYSAAGGNPADIWPAYATGMRGKIGALRQGLAETVARETGDHA